MSHEWEPTEADKRGGWTLNMKWLESVQAKIPNDDGQDVSLETVESVLLAAGFPVSPEAHAEAGDRELRRWKCNAGHEFDAYFVPTKCAYCPLPAHIISETRPTPAANTEGLRELRMGFIHGATWAGRSLKSATRVANLRYPPDAALGGTGEGKP